MKVLSEAINPSQPLHQATDLIELPLGACSYVFLRGRGYKSMASEGKWKTEGQVPRDDGSKTKL